MIWWNMNEDLQVPYKSFQKLNFLRKQSYF